MRERFRQPLNYVVNNMPEKQYDSSKEHPKPEEMLLRQAIKFLTPKQRMVWEYWNYDRLTQDAIAKKMKISQPMVVQHIQACEKRITKYCKANMGTFELLKQEFGER